MRVTQPMMGIDLNCDVGESADPDRMAVEERILPHVTSVNIACGVHAGDPDLMRRMVELARDHGVAIGAHPGFRDREESGRREQTILPAQVENLVAYQVGALGGVAALAGARLSHVKPHGALYNIAVRDRALAAAIARGVAAVSTRLVLFGLAGSLLIEAARTLGLQAAAEAFADRAYAADGTLVPRDRSGALIHDETEVVERVLRMVREGVVRSFDGSLLRLRPDTICIHGDTPGADRLAVAVRHELANAGIRVAPVSAAGDART